MKVAFMFMERGSHGMAAVKRRSNVLPPDTVIHAQAATMTKAGNLDNSHPFAK